MLLEEQLRGTGGQATRRAQGSGTYKLSFSITVQHPTADFFPGYAPIPAAPGVESFKFNPDALVAAALSQLDPTLLFSMPLDLPDGSGFGTGVADAMSFTIPALNNLQAAIISGAVLNVTTIRTVLVLPSPSPSNKPKPLVVPPPAADATAALIPIVAGAAGGAVLLMIAFAVYCLYCRKDEDDEEDPREKMASSRPTPSARRREGAGGADDGETVSSVNPLRRGASPGPLPRITREHSAHAIGSPRKAPVGRGYIRPVGTEIAVPPPPRRGSRAEPEQEEEPEATVVVVRDSRVSRAAFAPTGAEEEGAGAFTGVNLSFGEGSGVRSHSRRSSSFRAIPGIPEAVIVATPRAGKTGDLPKGTKGDKTGEAKAEKEAKGSKGEAKAEKEAKEAKGKGEAKAESKAETKAEAKAETTRSSKKSKAAK